MDVKVGREDNRLGVFENRVMREISEPEGPDTDGRISLHSDEVHNLYFSSNIVRVVIKSRVRWAGHTARMWENRGACRVLIGESEGERQLGRRRRKLEGNVIIVFKKWYWNCGLD
jgi:hypothetical protein